jgi:hypothetical protein
MKSVRNFNELPKNEQVYTLFHDGKELFTRSVKSYVIRLFVVYDQFVEIWYNSEKNIIEKIEAVTDRDLYKNYNDKINLSELLKK